MMCRIALLLITFAVTFASCRQKASDSGRIEKALPLQKEIAIGDSPPFTDVYMLDSLRKNKLIYLWHNKGDSPIPGYKGDTIQTIVTSMDSLSVKGRIVYSFITETRLLKESYHSAGAFCLICFYKKSKAGDFIFVRSEALSFSEPLLNGSWGKFPPTTLIKLGFSNYGYKVEPGFSGFGGTSTGIYLYKITDSLTLRKIFALDIAHYDNYNNCSDSAPDIDRCYAFNTDIYFEEWESMYDRLRVRKWGTDLVHNKIVNIDSTFYYRLRDKEYELIEINVNEKNTDSK